MVNISVALATYNGVLFLREQLDSILNQTLQAAEIIVCDDCSTDGTWLVLREYAEKYACFKLFQNDENIGFMRNFEKAMRLCSGDYIALSDQDDIWLPDHLQILLEGIGDKMCVVGDAELIDSKGFRMGHKLSYCENLDFIPENDLQKAYFILFYRNQYQGASMMFRATFLDKTLPIPGDVEYHDSWLVFVACFYGFQPLREVVTLYRRHDKAVTGNKIRKIRLRALVYHLLFGRVDYRPMMVSAIKERIDHLSKDQMAFLQKAEKYYSRKNSFLGRIVNFIFELRYYKLIYGCK